MFQSCYMTLCMYMLKNVFFFLAEDNDWNIIIAECDSLSSKWRKLSTYLGLSRTLIDSIRENHPNDIDDCLSDALGQWIAQNYDTKKFGMPSWQTLLKAIALIDMQIFRKLASEHEGELVYY